MLSLIVWCMISVTKDGEQVETAALGKVVGSKTVDFSEYARKQGYEGDYSKVKVSEQSCIDENE
jgi:hypothetical protein